MVKLFKKSGEKQKVTFKFNPSINLKKIPLEEYAHVVYAFHRGMSELDRVLKESLLENYISFNIFGRISEQLELEKFRKYKIPDVPSIKTLFYSKAIDLEATGPETISRIEQIRKKRKEIPGPPPFEAPPQKPSEPPKSVTGSPPLSPSKSPTRPKITFSKTISETFSQIKPAAPLKPERESDRATGIAILRKQMAEELKRIRKIIPGEN